MHGKMIRPSTSIGNNGLPGEKSGWKRARKRGRVVHNYIDGKEGEIIGETGVFREFFKFFSLYIPIFLERMAIFRSILFPSRYSNLLVVFIHIR